MTARTQGFWPTVLWMAVAVGLSAQAPAPPRPAPVAQQPTFRVQTEAVTQDVVVKDDRGLFISDLRPGDFEIYEDGVKQTIISMSMIAGGRVANVLDAPPAAPPEGLILPPTRQVTDNSGRIFLFFVDDLQIQFSNTVRIRNLFKKIAKELVHEGDLFGMVSSGPSSISQDLTYDRKRLDQLIDKMTGDGLRPDEIVNLPSGAGGPSLIKHRAHVAMSTMEEALNNLAKVHNRRKALVWVSEGYDFIPFQASRLGLMDPQSPFLQNAGTQLQNMDAAQNAGSAAGCTPGDVTCQSQAYNATNPQYNPDSMYQQQSEEFADADLALELAEVTRAANRANVTIYTIDPRGLVGPMSDIDQPIDPQQWAAYIQKSQDTLRQLADDTGGQAVVNMNDYDKAFKRIDNDTSDYYVLGYYSSNTDSSHRRRQIDVKVLRKGATVTAERKEYVTKTPQIIVPPPPRTPVATPAVPPKP